MVVIMIKEIKYRYSIWMCFRSLVFLHVFLRLFLPSELSLGILRFNLRALFVACHIYMCNLNGGRHQKVPRFFIYNAYECRKYNFCWTVKCLCIDLHPTVLSLFLLNYHSIVFIVMTFLLLALQYSISAYVLISFISCCHLFSKHDPCTNYLFSIAFTGESTAGCAANFVFALWMQILEDFITETLCYLSSGIFVA